MAHCAALLLHLKTMRRALSTLLLLALSLPVVAPPFISGSAESALPACCRRHGAHHCAMGGASVAVSSGSRAIAPICPYSRIGHGPLMLPHAFVPRTAARIASAELPGAVIAEAEAGYRISSIRTRQERGPPAVSLL